MGLQDKIAQLIADEIANDPQKVGYAGKTDEEIEVLLNSGVTRQVITNVTDQTPISRILSGVAFAQNVCDLKDVTASKTMTPVIVVKEEVING